MNGSGEYVCTDCGKTFYLRRTPEVPRCMSCQSRRKSKRNQFKRAMENELDIRTKEQKRFDEATRIIQSKYGDEWNDSIQLASKGMSRYGSIPEALMSIILAHAKMPFIPQQKIGKYRVDFCIPKIKHIIEVDGSVYHTNTKKELEREGIINYTIGLDWKIVHVPAEAIQSNIDKIFKWICKLGDTGDKNPC